jgi:hypothetical protein
MLINWTNQIKSFLEIASDSDRNQIIDSIKQDIKTLESTLFNGEKIILVFASGSRFEIYPLFENEELDIRNITKDFNQIYQFNSLKNRMSEIEAELRDALKNDPDVFAEFEKYIEFKHSSPLFSIDLYKDNKINKSYKKLTYRNIESYIHGILGGLGIVVDDKYAKYASKYK